MLLLNTLVWKFGFLIHCSTVDSIRLVNIKGAQLCVREVTTLVDKFSKIINRTIH